MQKSRVGTRGGKRITAAALVLSLTLGQGLPLPGSAACTVAAAYGAEMSTVEAETQLMLDDIAVDNDTQPLYEMSADTREREAAAAGELIGDTEAISNSEWSDDDDLIGGMLQDDELISAEVDSAEMIDSAIDSASLFDDEVSDVDVSAAELRDGLLLAEADAAQSVEEALEEPAEEAVFADEDEDPAESVDFVEAQTEESLTEESLTEDSLIKEMAGDETGEDDFLEDEVQEAAPSDIAPIVGNDIEVNTKSSFSAGVGGSTLRLLSPAADTEVSAGIVMSAASAASSVSAASASAGTGRTWYGRQLTGNKAVIYRALVNYYVTQGGTSTSLTINETDGLDITAYTYETTKTVATDDDGTETISYEDNADNKAVARAQLVSDVQSAWDAFKYDYPELYWYWGSTYVMSRQWSASQESISFYQVKLTYKVPFDGALGYRSAFRAGVAAVVSELRAQADYNQDGTLSERELAQAAHDYIITRMYYDSTRLALYVNNTSSDYTIFTPVGAFVDDETIGTGFVCEGYAKAYKILCTELGLDCIMIPGKARETSTDKEMGHMWNAVRIDGTWYLVDTTWDEGRSDYKYFEFAYYTKGDTRSAYERLSAASANAYTFVYPDISAADHTVTLVDDGLSTCTGYDAYACEDGDGVGFYLLTGDKAAGHMPDAAGVCAVCGTTVAAQFDLAGGAMTCDSDLKVTVTDAAGAVLKEETDYTVEFTDTEESLALKVSGINHYYGSLQAGVLTAALLNVSDAEYTGSVQRPVISRGTTGQTVLTEGTDYTLSSADSKDDLIKAGSRQILVTGIGAYTGTAVLTYTIAAKPLTTLKLSVGKTVCTYTGTAQTPGVTLTDPGCSGALLKEGTDYTVTYAQNVNVGTARVSVTGKGNYTGTAAASFTITKKSVGSSDITVSTAGSSYVYRGSAYTPAVTVMDKTRGRTLVKGTDYTLTYANNVNVGTARVTVTGKGNYTGTASTSFTITRKSVGSSDITVTVADGSYVYRGRAYTPAVTVTDKTRGRTLVKGSDYTLIYSHNVKAGTAQVKVTGQGNYRGRVKAAFTIRKWDASASISGVKALGSGMVRVTWKRLEAVSGYQIQYSTSKKFKSTVTKKKTVAGKSVKKVVLKNLQGNKTYYFRIRAYKVISGKKVYGSWSSVKITVPAQ